MSERKNLWYAIVLAVIISAAVFAFVVRGEAKAPASSLTAESIGVVDYAQVQEKCADFTRVKDLKKAYDAELNNFAAYQRQVAASSYAELERKKDEERAGKTEAEKQEIDRKYERLAQDKATEVNQAIQAKMKELQEKLNSELAKADERLRQVIAAVCADKGLKLVLTKSFTTGGAVVYYGGTDVTADVIAKGNEPAKK